MWLNMKILIVFWSYIGSKVFVFFEVMKYFVLILVGIFQCMLGIIIVFGFVGYDEIIEDVIIFNNMILVVVLSMVV